MNADTVFDDLAAEHAQLDALLSALRPEDWDSPSAAIGWSVSDVILHLAQSEEMVVLTVSGEQSVFARPEGVSLDELMDRAVAEDRGATYDQVLERWRRASFAAVEALRGCPPKERLSWAALPLSPRTLATTRIAEHWAHAQDIADPLGLGYPDTSRLRHIAWLAHRTLPYAFTVNGMAEPGPIRAELTGPDGDLWTFGEPDAPSRITGPAGEFCRVGAQRLTPEKTSLTTEGPDAATALTVIRNYAA
jgi:uncharacterized protein (TIGR03084 family)